jgi:hypothetical protein
LYFLATPLPSSWRLQFPLLAKENAVYAIGGYSSNNDGMNDIIKMECDSTGSCGSWSIVGYFEGGRNRHTALWVPKSAVPCIAHTTTTATAQTTTTKAITTITTTTTMISSKNRNKFISS